jgi:hypothetical protein
LVFLPLLACRYWHHTTTFAPGIRNDLLTPPPCDNTGTPPKATGMLYYAQNSTDTPAYPPPASLDLAAPALETLLRVNATQSNPLRGLTIQGIGFRDAAPTFMEPHGIPSGGDWVRGVCGYVAVGMPARMCSVTVSRAGACAWSHPCLLCTPALGHFGLMGSFVSCAICGFVLM